MQRSGSLFRYVAELKLKWADPVWKRDSVVDQPTGILEHLHTLSGTMPSPRMANTCGSSTDHQPKERERGLREAYLMLRNSTAFTYVNTRKKAHFYLAHLTFSQFHP